MEWSTPINVEPCEMKSRLQCQDLARRREEGCLGGVAYVNILLKVNLPITSSIEQEYIVLSHHRVSQASSRKVFLALYRLLA